MNKLYLTGIHRNYGFSYDMYRYVLKPMGFHCFQLDYQKRYRYLLLLLRKKYDVIWACSSCFLNLHTVLHVHNNYLRGFLVERRDAEVILISVNAPLVNT